MNPLFGTGYIVAGIVSAGILPLALGIRKGTLMRMAEASAGPEVSDCNDSAEDGGSATAD
jgi:hypothetical protein